jgi:hypothetical protein
METTHSKTRRTKSSSPKIVVSSWDKVWESFKEEKGKTSVEEMNTQGWKTEAQAAKEIGMSRKNVNYLANIGKIDLIKKRVFIGGITREINFVRPKC